MADAKKSLGRGGGKAAAAGTTMGAVDGYDGGGNDGDGLADGNLLAREENGKDGANVGAPSGDDNTAGSANNALAAAKRSSTRSRTPSVKAMEEAERKSAPNIGGGAMAKATAEAAAAGAGLFQPTSPVARVSQEPGGAFGQGLDARGLRAAAPDPKLMGLAQGLAATLAGAGATVTHTMGDAGAAAAAGAGIDQGMPPGMLNLANVAGNVAAATGAGAGLIVGKPPGMIQPGSTPATGNGAAAATGAGAGANSGMPPVMQQPPNLANAAGNVAAATGAGAGLHLGMPGGMQQPGANPATGIGAAATGAGAGTNRGMPRGMTLPPILTGIRLAISKLGPEVREPTYQVGELAWQREIGGDTARGKVFQQEICSQQSLRVFGFVKDGSPIVHLLHSMAVY